MLVLTLIFEREKKDLEKILKFWKKKVKSKWEWWSTKSLH